MLIMSSYNRMYRYLGDDDQDKTTSYRLKRRLTNRIQQVSYKIQNYLARNLQIVDSRTEYFNVGFGQTVYWPNATPVTTLTSVYQDPTGEWEGSESEVTDSYIGTGGESIVIPQALQFTAVKGLRAIYTGGMAYDGVKSTFTVGDATAFTVGNFVNGDDSDALGIVSSASGTTLIVENLQGIFTTEGITEYTDEDLDTASGETDTISSIDKQSLAEAYPDLVLACEMEVRYHYKHKDDYEQVGATRDGADIRRDRFRKPEIGFMEEVRQMINQYRKPVL